MAVHPYWWRFKSPGYTPMDPPKRIQNRISKIYKIILHVKEIK